MEREIGKLLRLLKDQYSATSEERLNDRIEKLEKHTHRLSDIAEYLVSLKYAKARDHRDEVEDFKEILNKCTEEVFVVLHERQVANPAAPAQAAAQAPRTTVKASALELKPEKLTHDSSASMEEVLQSLLRLGTNVFSPLHATASVLVQLH